MHYVDESTIPASSLHPSGFLPEKSDLTFLHQRMKAVVMEVLAKHLPTLHELTDVMETTIMHKCSDEMARPSTVVSLKNI